MKLRILVPPAKTHAQTMYIVVTHKEHNFFFFYYFFLGTLFLRKLYLKNFNI